MFTCSLALDPAAWLFLLFVVVGGALVDVFLALVVGWPPVVVPVGIVPCLSLIVLIPLRLAMLEIAASLVALHVMFVMVKYHPCC